MARWASGAVSGQVADTVFMAIRAGKAGTSAPASETKQPVIIGQLGIASLANFVLGLEAGLGPILAARASGQQPIGPFISIGDFISPWPDGIIAAEQPGEIAIATP